jgi:hypothetical protein
MRTQSMPKMLGNGGSVWSMGNTDRHCRRVPRQSDRAVDHHGRNGRQRIECFCHKRSRSGIAAGHCCHLRQAGRRLRAGCGVSVARRWMLAFFLPPCARALNPAEMACPNPKARLRRIEQRPIDQVIDAFTKICNRFSPDDCWNVFCEAGCGSNEKRGALAFGKHRETYKEPLNQCHFGRGASSCS